MVTTVYIVRHCEALGNVEGDFQGSTDFDISEKGSRQLEKLSERFKNINVDVIYSSPLKRAYKTALACTKYNNLTIITDNELAELNGGLMECKPWSSLDELFPEEYSVWNSNFALFSAPEGESVRDVYKRMVNAFNRIIAANKGKEIVIFSHGCAIRILMCYIKGIPLEQIDKVLWCDNTAISCISVDDNGKISIIFENDYTHIMNDETTTVNRMWWGDQEKTNRVY